jgi:pimeloyl-ACP methyl ester carboxylesterase
MIEEALAFGELKSLIGILARPATEPSASTQPAVILLNPGIVHRVGPGRIYVRIARMLVALGFPVLRFDFSGIGDSPVRNDHLPFQKSAIKEIQDAMDILETTCGTSRFILLGGCSGARVALHTALCDARVVGAIPINFPVTDEEDSSDPKLVTRRLAHYYWNFAFLRPESWRKLISGKANYRNLTRAVLFLVKHRLGLTSTQSSDSVRLAEDLRSLAERNVKLSFVYSGSDPRLGELQDALNSYLRRLRRSEKISIKVIPHTDHTFSSLEDQEQLLKNIANIVSAIASFALKSQARWTPRMLPEPAGT